MHCEDSTPQTGHASLQCTVFRQKKKTNKQQKAKKKSSDTSHDILHLYPRLRITTPENDKPPPYNAPGSYDQAGQYMTFSLPADNYFYINT